MITPEVEMTFQSEDDSYDMYNIYGLIKLDLT
jgi:hypothetical protein